LRNALIEILGGNETAAEFADRVMARRQFGRHVDSLFIGEDTAKALAAGHAGDDIDRRLQRELKRVEDLDVELHNVVRHLIDKYASEALTPVQAELLAQLLAGIDPNHPKENIQKISLSIHRYYKKFRQLPLASPDGETGLGWRVHLLPFLDQQELYDKFKLDESWDSRHNSGLIPRMPTVFQTPTVPETGKTEFHVFVGEGTPLGGAQPVRISEFFGGGSKHAIMLVMAGRSTAVPWTRPGGLEYNGDDPLGVVGELTFGGYPVVMCDGAIGLISPQATPQEAAALIRYQDALPDTFDELFKPWPQ